MHIFFIAASLDSPLLLERLQLFKDGENVRKIHLLDLKHSDSRPDLVHLRNSGVQHFIVDMKAELLNIFFDQVNENTNTLHIVNFKIHIQMIIISI